MDTPNDKQNSLESLKDSIIKALEKNLDHVWEEFKNPYNLTEVDFIRHEVCICLTLEQNQAAITLTNHLIEKYLKYLLIHNEQVKDVVDLNAIIEHYKTQVEAFGGKDLSVIINKCRNVGLLSKEQAKLLHEIREKVRNPFSHADIKQTFGDQKIRIGFGNMLIPDSFKSGEFELSSLVFMHGKAQKDIADNNALDYFKIVDKLIRETKR